MNGEMYNHRQPEREGKGEEKPRNARSGYWRDNVTERL